MRVCHVDLSIIPSTAGAYVTYCFVIKGCLDFEASGLLHLTYVQRQVFSRGRAHVRYRQFREVFQVDGAVRKDAVNDDGFHAGTILLGLHIVVSRAGNFVLAMVVVISPIRSVSG